MCECQSYNRPEFGGSVSERILHHGKYFHASARSTICVDDCIADTIERLWAAGVVTAACCCGHNGQSPIANGMPNVMIVDPAQAKVAADILADDARDWWITIWAGSKGGV